MRDDLTTDWFGTAAPYMNLLSGFGMRWKELGHGEYTNTKQANQVKNYTTVSFGSNQIHHIL